MSAYTLAITYIQKYQHLPLTAMELFTHLVAIIEDQNVPIPIAVGIELALPDGDHRFASVSLNVVSESLPIARRRTRPYEFAVIVVDVRAGLRNAGASRCDYRE